MTSLISAPFLILEIAYANGDRDAASEKQLWLSFFIRFLFTIDYTNYCRSRHTLPKKLESANLYLPVSKALIVPDVRLLLYRGDLIVDKYFINSAVESSCACHIAGVLKEPLLTAIPAKPKTVRLYSKLLNSLIVNLCSLALREIALFTLPKLNRIFA